MKLRMKIFILCSFLFTTSSFSQESPDPKKGETLIVRRIVEIWKEGDYKTARNQILYFLEKFPETRWRDQLYGMLGDSYVREERYQDALEAYGELRKDEYLEKTLINRLQCLFSLSEYGKVVDEAQMGALHHPTHCDANSRICDLPMESSTRHLSTLR